MPYDGVIASRRPFVSVPGGTQRAPWLQPNTGPIEVARTYVVAYGPELLRAADADEPSNKRSRISGGSLPWATRSRLSA